MDLPIEAAGASLRKLDQERVSQTGVYLWYYLHQFLTPLYKALDGTFSRPREEFLFGSWVKTS